MTDLQKHIQTVRMALEEWRNGLHPRDADEVFTALSALEAALPVWRPIETAPKDGTKILLGKIAGHPDHPTALWWATSGFWSDKWGNWNDGIEPAGLASPTHWQPLPEPPKQEKQG